MEVISAWQIYLVLQLDSINHALAAGAIFSGVVAAVIRVFLAIHVSDDSCSWNAQSIDERKAFRASIERSFMPAIIGFALMSPAAVLLPSTKTAAAMFVIPAIANNERIQAEAGELYTLAKDALREAAKPDEVKPKGAK